MNEQPHPIGRDKANHDGLAALAIVLLAAVLIAVVINAIV
jgi:hypothetical protein